MINSTLTRVQAFAVVALMALLVCGGVAISMLGKISEPTVALTRGIETSWPSDLGNNRLWSFCIVGESNKSWISDHVAALTIAQEIMPPRNK